MWISELKKFRQHPEGFADFDWIFGEFLQRSANAPYNTELFCAGALLAKELREGRVGLFLAEFAGQPFPPEHPDAVMMPELDMWHQALCAPECAGVIGKAEQDDGKSLLLLDENNRLMMRSYLRQEKLVAEALLRKCRRLPEKPLLPPADPQLHELQHLAVCVGSCAGILVLSGGPGTGKTTVAGRILSYQLQQNPQLHVMIAAPTGKAQQRLLAELHANAEKLPPDSPAKLAMKKICGGTIHRLLYDREMMVKLAKCDLLLLDECSMISLELMSKLLAAVPEKCRLILAGDHNQLASVGSGTVFGELCHAARANVVPAGWQEFFPGAQEIIFEDVSGGELPFTGFLVELTRNYRSAQAPQVSSVSAALRRSESAADEAAVTAMICNASTSDFTTEAVPPEKFRAGIKKFFASSCDKAGNSLLSLPQLAAGCRIEELPQLLEISECCKILCAVNEGICGVDEFNKMAMEILHLTPARVGEWLPGTVLLITANDRRSGLNNGDSGVVYRDAVTGEVRAVFASRMERSFAIGELPEHRAGFAVTIHKAQGSGYQQVLMVLPEYITPGLSRELLYTGITRAANYLKLWADKDVVAAAVKKRMIFSANIFINAAKAQKAAKDAE